MFQVLIYIIESWLIYEYFSNRQFKSQFRWTWIRWNLLSYSLNLEFGISVWFMPSEFWNTSFNNHLPSLFLSIVDSFQNYEFDQRVEISRK